MSQPLCYLHEASAVCALGDSYAQVAEQLFSASQSPLQISDSYSPGRPLPLGQVQRLPAADTRNNALLLAAATPLLPAIAALKARYGAARIGIVLGSSTSGIAEGEKAVAELLRTGAFPPGYDYGQQEIAAPSQYLAQLLDVQGPAWTVSTACTSGAKAIASGARLLALGVCDAVVVGGADSLCHLTVEGFLSLAAVSEQLCNPFSRNRRGINIGEGAGLVILRREPSAVALVGVGETSDAHHISAPEPEGRGAEAAMRAALACAALAPAAIDYINLHGTATEQNDRMESLAVARVFDANIACGSTKALTGHTLGAAGALEALFCAMALMRGDGQLPRQLWDGECDPALAPLTGLGASQLGRPLRYAMSNSFAFGGNNISLILESCHDRPG